MSAFIWSDEYPYSARKCCELKENRKTTPMLWKLDKKQISLAKEGSLTS